MLPLAIVLFSVGPSAFLSGRTRCQAIVADWVPQDQRSRWLSLIISGLQVTNFYRLGYSRFGREERGWREMPMRFGMRFALHAVVSIVEHVICGPRGTGTE